MSAHELPSLHHIAAFYHFVPIAEGVLDEREAELMTWAEALGVEGLVILAPEGVNATVSAASSGSSGNNDARARLESFLLKLGERLSVTLVPKWSTSEVRPFRRFKVKQRAEIVTLGRPDQVPYQRYPHLSPEKWHEALQEPGVVCIDTRNRYEIEIGKFKGAVDPGTEEFHEFPEFVKTSGLPKDQKILIYCTGGIRCEKAALTFQEQGYTNVHPLDGGILKYLETHPGGGAFEGECFVFDHRVAVNAELKPSNRYALCPHCGGPGDHAFQCVSCKSPAKCCTSCSTMPIQSETCSKNCAERIRRQRAKAQAQNK